MTTEEIQERVARSLGSVASVLDVGCGDCSLVRFLARVSAVEAIGIDLSSDFPVKVWLDADDGSVHTALCIYGDARAMGFPNERFDSAVCVRALHEMEDPEKILFEVKRVLSPGGVLLIADFARGEPSEDESYYTSSQVEHMLVKQKFEQIGVELSPHDTFLFASGRKPMEYC